MPGTLNEFYQQHGVEFSKESSPKGMKTSDAGRLLFLGRIQTEVRLLSFATESGPKTIPGILSPPTGIATQNGARCGH
jgi:hypothetical protein